MQTVCNTYCDAGKGNLTAQNTRKPSGGRGSAPDPAEGAYSTPANPLVGGRGWLSPPQEPQPPLSALRASPLLPYFKISSDAFVHNRRPQDRCAVDKQRAARQYILCLDTPSSCCTLVTPLPRKSCRLRGQRYRTTKAARVMGRSVLPADDILCFHRLYFTGRCSQVHGTRSGVNRNIYTDCI